VALTTGPTDDNDRDRRNYFAELMRQLHTKKEQG